MNAELLRYAWQVLNAWRLVLAPLLWLVFLVLALPSVGSGLVVTLALALVFIFGVWGMIAAGRAVKRAREPSAPATAAAAARS
jgi:uncharacterized membrane protein